MKGSRQTGNERLKRRGEKAARKERAKIKWYFQERLRNNFYFSVLGAEGLHKKREFVQFLSLCTFQFLSFHIARSDWLFWFLIGFLLTASYRGVVLSAKRVSTALAAKFSYSGSVRRPDFDGMPLCPESQIYHISLKRRKWPLGYVGPGISMYLVNAKLTKIGHCIED